MEPTIADMMRALTEADAPELTREQLIALVERYPGFVTPAIMLLRDAGVEADAALCRRLQAVVALNARDIDSQSVLSSTDGALFASFYPPEQSSAASTTDDAITTFLETYGHSTAEEDALLEQMIFNPVPDYGAVLTSTDEAEPDDDEASIAAFMSAFSQPAEQAAEPEEPKEPLTEPDSKARSRKSSAKPAESSSLSESLAKIYIKQRRYDKAYEIIRQLCLNNPKKSVYFADQLRFLQKLMLISSYE